MVDLEGKTPTRRVNIKLGGCLEFCETWLFVSYYRYLSTSWRFCGENKGGRERG